MGLRPLVLASYCNGVGSSGMVKLLLDNGADPTIPISLELFSYLRQFRFSHFITNLSPIEATRSSIFNLNSGKNKIILNTDALKTKVVYPIEVAAAVGNTEAVSFMIASQVTP